MKGFKITCLNCGREIIVDEENKLDDMLRKDITGFLEMNGDYEVECKCGNRIIINEIE